MRAPSPLLVALCAGLLALATIPSPSAAQKLAFGAARSRLSHAYVPPPSSALAQEPMQEEAEAKNKEGARQQRQGEINARSRRENLIDFGGARIGKENFCI